MDYAAERTLAALWKKSRSMVEEKTTVIDVNGLQAYRSKYMGDANGFDGTTTYYELCLSAMETEELRRFFDPKGEYPQKAVDQRICRAVDESYRRYQRRSTALLSGMLVGPVAVIVTIALLNLHENGWAYLFGIAFMAVLLVSICAERWMIEEKLSSLSLKQTMEAVEKAHSSICEKKICMVTVIVCLVVMAGCVLGIATDGEWWEDTVWMYQNQERMSEIREAVRQELQEQEEDEGILPAGTNKMKGDEIPASVKKYLEEQGVSIDNDETYSVTFVP